MNSSLDEVLRNQRQAYPIQKCRHGASLIKENRLAILWLGYPPAIKLPNIIWISLISLISGEVLSFAIFASFCSNSLFFIQRLCLTGH
jgi:hypothetical protein